MISILDWFDIAVIIEVRQKTNAVVVRGLILVMCIGIHRVWWLEREIWNVRGRSLVVDLTIVVVATIFRRDRTLLLVPM